MNLLLIGAFILSIALAAGSAWAVGTWARVGPLGAFLVAVLQVVVATWVAGVPLHSLAPGTILAAQALLTALLLIGIRWRRRPPVAGAPEQPAPEQPAPWPLWLRVLLAVAVVQTASTLVQAVIFPPYAWDGLTYHLPAAALWVQQGYIGHVNWNDIWANVYPQTGEVLMAWCFAFVRNQTLVQLVQLPFAIAGALATTLLARQAGLGVNPARFAGLCFYLAPIVLTQAAVPYVDVEFAALFLIAVYFAGERRPLWAGIALGLLAGVKTAGLGYAAVVALIATALAPPGQRWRTLLAMAVPVGVLSCYWYVRTWVQYGNPIYPIAVPFVFRGEGSLSELVMGANVPAAYQGHPIYALLSTWFERTLFWNYDTRQAGFGPVWPVVCLPALPYLVARRGAPAWRLAAYLGAAFLIQPMNWWTRYAIALFPLGAIALAAVLESDDPWLRRSALALSLALVLFGAGLGTASQLALGPLRHLSAPDAIAHRMTRLGVYYTDEFRWLETVAPAGVRIAAINVDFPYVLLGEQLQNRVSFGIEDTTQYVMAPPGWTSPNGWRLYDTSAGYRVYERKKG